MYDNIGGKIKTWAKWIFVVEAFVAVVGGFAFMIVTEDMELIGLLVLVLGPIIAWISSWVLYGYGQLIQNSDIIAAEYTRKNEKHEKVVAKNNAKKEAQRREKAKVIIANPDVADDEYIDIICPICKETLSYTKEQLRSGDVVCPMCDTYISL